MDKTDLPYLSVTELSCLIESKEVSPIEIIQAYLDRIDGSTLTTLNIRNNGLREAREVAFYSAMSSY